MCSGPLLTDAERATLEAVGKIAGAMRTVIGDGPNAENDMHEAIRSIHALQAMVMSQAAARAYPDEFRLLGKSLAR